MKVSCAFSKCLRLGCEDRTCASKVEGTCQRQQPFSTTGASDCGVTGESTTSSESSRTCSSTSHACSSPLSSALCATREIVNTSAELRGNRSLTTPCTAKCTKRVDGLPDPVAALATLVQSFRSTLNGAPSSERTRQLKDDGAALYDLLLRPAEAVISCAAIITVEMDETWFERDCCFLYTGNDAAEHTPRLTRSASSRARGSHEAVSYSSAARTAPSLVRRDADCVIRGTVVDGITE